MLFVSAISYPINLLGRFSSNSAFPETSALSSVERDDLKMLNSFVVFTSVTIYHSLRDVVIYLSVYDTGLRANTVRLP